MAKKKRKKKHDSRAVIFDLGMVLIGLDWERAVNRVAPFCAIPREEIYPRVESCNVVGPYEEGKIDDDEFCMGLIEALEADASIEEMAACWRDIFIRRPEMEKLFRDTRRHAPVGILSDTSTLHWNYISKICPDIANPDGLVLSYEIGSRKPEARNFAIAASVLDKKPEDCIYFDDRPENVKAAAEQGMQAHVYAGTTDTKKKIHEFLGL